MTLAERKYTRSEHLTLRQEMWLIGSLRLSAGQKPADDRQAARPQEGADHGPLRALGARLGEKVDRSKVQSKYADKIERILAHLGETSTIDNIDIPSFRLHPLKENLASRWAVSVPGNWRVVFRFEEGHASEVDILDYH